MRETRFFPRIPCQLPLHYRDGAALRQAYIASLSQGGVFIKTSRPLPVGTEMVMEIALADAPSVTVRGRVVWDRLVGREDGMGVAFTEPVPEPLKMVLTARVA